MTSNNYENKLKRMRIIEMERRQRIFNDKQRTIGVDKLALENQIREKLLSQQRFNLQEDVFKKNLNFYNEQAIQEEQLLKYKAYKESEDLRQIENMLLAKEQILKNRRINEEAMANVPTEDYYNYFNISSR